MTTLTAHGQKIFKSVKLAYHMKTRIHKMIMIGESDVTTSLPFKETNYYFVGGCSQSSYKLIVIYILVSFKAYKII